MMAWEKIIATKGAPINFLIWKETNRKMCQRYEQVSIVKGFSVLCSNNWQKWNFKFTQLQKQVKDAIQKTR